MSKKSSRSLYDYLDEGVQFSLVSFLLNNTINHSPPTNRSTSLTLPGCSSNTVVQRGHKRWLHTLLQSHYKSCTHLSSSLSHFSLPGDSLQCAEGPFQSFMFSSREATSNPSLQHFKKCSGRWHILIIKTLSNSFLWFYDLNFSFGLLIFRHQERKNRWCQKQVFNCYESCFPRN